MVKKGAMVVVESTVAPRTTENVVKTIRSKSKQITLSNELGMKHP